MSPKKKDQKEEEEEEENEQTIINNMISQLPKSKGDWGAHSNHVLYKQTWCPKSTIPHLMAFQSSFDSSNENDIFVATLPKSGTTWLKALVFSIVHRARYSSANTPLRSSNPHELVPYVEAPLSGRSEPREDQTTAAGGRLWSTHAPLALWPDSPRARIVYIARNPLDVLSSGWHFYDVGSNGAKWTAEEYATRFLEGDAHSFGPYWNHVLGFWEASRERPEKVLFLKYEDLRNDTVSEVKKIAQFIGFPFTKEEEKIGVVEEIVELCSLKSLRSMEVNVKGELFVTYGNKSYFRKGEIGDWVNHITPEMARLVTRVVEDKLAGSGLSFNSSI